MLHRLRSYRFITALLVGTLMLGSSVALVQHACAMAGQVAEHVQTCCCDDAPMPMHDASTPVEEGMPCHDAPAPPVEDRSALADSAAEDCCVIEQPASMLGDMMRAEAPPTMQLLVSAVVVATDRRVPVESGELRPADVRGDAYAPPHRLHLLHATFLN